MSNPITQVTLKNGMKVMLKEIHTAPIISSWIWYRVGSADETPGKSGLAHFLEHLMFKATAGLADGEYSKTVARNGGQDTASPSLDYTNYYFRIAEDPLPEMMRMAAEPNT